ncbi:MAG: Putrescine transport ATP-binding protein PotA [Firmicutes bacterium]|nr:Putrescine transport ATP-binding protein PotA [Bacillota bacterium]MDI6706422.1 ABC transporter ATP-binding protein [Bacillota bacterium]
MLEVKNVTVSYGEFTALGDISLKLNRGEICTLLGPSGCGKTTLLYTIAGLVKQKAGEIVKDDNALRMSLIPQHYGLLPWKRAVDNVALSLIIKGCDRRSSRLKARGLLAEMGLSGVEDRFPGQMSGGQKQRVALARSLVFQPDLLLMDEPFSSLDQLTREELQEFLLMLHEKNEFTVLMVTHSIEEAVYLGQRIIVMGGEPGRIRRALQNPLWGVKDKRTSAMYYEVCRQVRGCLEV